MTEQEKINEQFQRQLDAQNANFEKAMLKIDMTLEELRQQREDIRRLNEKHDADMKAMQEKQDADIKAMQEKQDAKMHEMNQRFYEKFDEMNKKIDDNFKTLSNQINSNFVQTMLGFGAIAAAVGGIVIAAFK